MSILDAFGLDGRVAIVTGASSGLGVEFADALAHSRIGVQLPGILESFVVNSEDTLGDPVITESAGDAPFGFAASRRNPGRDQLLLQHHLQLPDRARREHDAGQRARR